MNSKRLKYLIVKDQEENLFSIVFPEEISHQDVARIHSASDTRVISAGFCWLDKGVWHTNGRSDSLNMNGNPDDHLIIQCDFFG